MTSKRDDNGAPGRRRPTVPGYRSAPLPPVAHPAVEPPEIPSLLPAAELESGPQSTRLEPEPMHATRGHQRTLVGPAAPPARGAAPAPPEPPAAVSTPLPAVSMPGALSGPQLTPSLVAAAEKTPFGKQLLLIITAGTTIGGIITALGVQVVAVINATRPPSVTEIQNRLDALEKAKQGGNGLALETQARLAREKEITDAVTAAATKAATCDGMAERVQKLEDKLKK